MLKRPKSVWSLATKESKEVTGRRTQGRKETDLRLSLQKRKY